MRKVPPEQQEAEKQRWQKEQDELAAERRVREQKLAFMVAKKPRALAFETYQLCWPEELVYEDGRFQGFVMSRAAAGAIQLREFCTPRFRNASFADWQAKFDRERDGGVRHRLMLCANLALAIHAIHQTGRYVLVDLNPRNVLVTHTGHISMIDLDSIQIEDAVGSRVLFPSRVATPDYVPPEGIGVDLNERPFLSPSWDHFSLAVIFYQVIFGLHPFAASTRGRYEEVTLLAEKIRHGLFVHGPKRRDLANIPPLHQNFHRLPRPLRQLFHAGLGLDPERRPDTAAWWDGLVETIEDEGRSLAFDLNQPPPSASPAAVLERLLPRAAPAAPARPGPSASPSPSPSIPPTSVSGKLSLDLELLAFPTAVFVGLLSLFVTFILADLGRALLQTMTLGALSSILVVVAFVAAMTAFLRLLLWLLSSQLVYKKGHYYFKVLYGTTVFFGIWTLVFLEDSFLIAFWEGIKAIFGWLIGLFG